MIAAGYSRRLLVGLCVTPVSVLWLILGFEGSRLLMARTVDAMSVDGSRSVLKCCRWNILDRWQPKLAEAVITSPSTGYVG